MVISDSPIFLLVLGVATAVIADVISDWLRSWLYDDKDKR